MRLDLQTELSQYGAAKEAIKLFDAKNDASLLRYVDLLPGGNIAGSKDDHRLLAAGAVEVADHPLIYLVRADLLARSPQSQQEALSSLVRRLTCRADGDYVAVVRPGELTIFPLGLNKRAPRGTRIKADDARAPLLLSDLAGGVSPFNDLAASEGIPRQQSAKAEALHRLLFKLLIGVSDELRKSCALSLAREGDQVLPLVGRALFSRFLIDRRIINVQAFPEIYRDNEPEMCFSTPQLAARTCAWLDDKFNGELLPLFEAPYPEYKDYLRFFRSVHRKSTKVLHQLSNVMYRAPDGHLSLDLDWSGIDFAHVPVGLLSEVYEDYAHRFYKDDAQRESVRFTPRNIASFTVNQAFEGLPEDKRHLARVLDPAAGAGVFLVLAFQRLVAERWAATGRRPDTEEIRRILYGQICGCDINSSALTLAALSLYLTALELDPCPYPPEKLGFERLLDKVLFNMREADEAYPYRKPVLGSLGPRGQAATIGRFEIITGNPPWTAWAGKTGAILSSYVTTMVRNIVKGRGEGLADIAKSYEHNDRLPDIAFLWRALEWAKPNGIISLIVHGRLLFKRAQKGADVRNAFFRAVRVTGILNGSELTRLWPSLNQPFCILFARNETPKTTDRFNYVTPELDVAPGGRFRMRIDHECAQPVDLKTLFAKPHLLKSLYRGGRLDVELIGRLDALMKPVPKEVEKHGDSATTELPVQSAEPNGLLATRWGEYLTAECCAYGQGFIPGEGYDTRDLRELKGKMLTTNDKFGLRINTSDLGPFTARKLLRPRKPEIYQPPLTLINEGFGEKYEDIRSRMWLEDIPLIYNRSFYGFSAANHPTPDMLVKYLFILSSSDLFAYYILQTSAKFGVERRTVFMEDIENFPIFELESLEMRKKEAMLGIADNLDLQDVESWRALNEWVNDLYHLTTVDQQVIRDTLDTRMPYAASLERALTVGAPKEIEEFRSTLSVMLGALYQEPGETLEIRTLEVPVATWVMFDIVTVDVADNLLNDAVSKLARKLAEEEGASRVFIKLGNGQLRLAVRNQYRYLTKSRARLAALDILRKHGYLFRIKPVAA
jgi:hypothetical protein